MAEHNSISILSFIIIRCRGWYPWNAIGKRGRSDFDDINSSRNPIMNRQQSHPTLPQRAASKPLLRSLTAIGDDMKSGAMSGSLMGFDKRNPSQKPLPVGFSPKAGTVSKPYTILKGGSSPPKGPANSKLDSPKLRELGGDGFSVIRTVPGVNALLSSPPRESNVHFGRFMGTEEDDDNASLTSNQQQFGGLASHLNGGGR